MAGGESVLLGSNICPTFVRGSKHTYLSKLAPLPNSSSSIIHLHNTPYLSQAKSLYFYLDHNHSPLFNMSGIVQKAKELAAEVKGEVHKATGPKDSTHSTTGVGSGTSGTHSTTGAGSGTAGHPTTGVGSGTTGTHSATGTGYGTSGSTNAGPHDSNMANKLYVFPFRPSKRAVFGAPTRPR